MNRIYFCLLLVICSLFPGTPVLANDQQNLVVAAASDFTTLVDADNFLAAYWSGSELLRLANDEREWTAQQERAQVLVGKVTKRTLKAVRSIQTYPGLPDGDYVLIYFETRTTYKAKAAEVLLLRDDQGLYQVCSYSIR